MNILYIHRTRCSGVEGVHIKSISEGFRTLGHQVQLFSPYGAAATGGTQSRGVKDRVFKVISRIMPEFLFELTELNYNFYGILKLLKSFKKENVDLIYERYAIFSIIGVLAAGWWRRPIIMEINYTSLCPLARHRSWLLKPVAKMCDRFIYRRVDGFVAVSSYLKEQLVREYKIDGNNILVLPNGGDPEKLKPDNKGDELRKNTQAPQNIGFVGGFFKWHGLDLLVDAFSEIAQERTNIGLMLVGDGPERADLERRVDQMGLSSRVQFVGQVAHDSMHQWISKFTIGVMPDSNEYGSPVKVFEYMAMGKPVVVPDYGPLRDCVENGKEGLFFKPRDAHAMASCFRLLLQDEKLYWDMSAAAREKIVTKHNWLENARRTLELAKGRISEKMGTAA
jgi:glycosyltransferase involved in cell wall biosynthesis